MSRVVLVALGYFGPLVVALALLVVRRWLPRRRRVSVAELLARLERERLCDPTFRLASRTPGLPPGWRWPSADPDQRSRHLQRCSRDRL